jgi:hypothetical protein
MIAFDTTIRVLLGVVERVWDEFFDHGLQRLGKISDHLLWFTVSVERRSEEHASASKIASG